MTKTTEAQKKANAKYDKENTIQKMIKLNKNTDKDIIQYLNTLPNFQGEIKRLLRKEMAEIKKTEEAYNNEYDSDGFWVGYSE
jgi:hypothetical protein